MASKEQVLSQLKSQWKSAVIKQYQKEPDKVKNSDVDKNTNDIMNNGRAASVMKKVGITRDDIFKILSEIKHEVIDNSYVKSFEEGAANSIKETINTDFDIDGELKVRCEKCPIYNPCKTPKYHTKAKDCPLVRLMKMSNEYGQVSN
jgi:hypothetical protein